MGGGGCDLCQGWLWAQHRRWSPPLWISPTEILHSLCPLMQPCGGAASPPAEGAALYPPAVPRGGALPWGPSGSVGLGAGLCHGHGAGAGGCNCRDLPVTVLTDSRPAFLPRTLPGRCARVPSRHAPGQPGCPRPTWGRHSWQLAGTLPDSGRAAHVGPRCSRMPTERGCIRGASLGTPPPTPPGAAIYFLRSPLGRERLSPVQLGACVALLLCPQAA